ncbi:MAG: hypothetical protein K9M19_07700 [Candidatus Marinimicrobia bacterium]|nr:hypothetical protein [Candidatus Neomarinimicrobiota bacterium]
MQRNIIFSVMLLYSTLTARNWTEPVYFEPQVYGESFAVNRNETKIYYVTGAIVYWRDKIGPNQWSEPHQYVGDWNTSHLTRNFWIDPDEQVAIWSDYTNNWQLFFSRKDSMGNWGPRRYFPQYIDTPESEWWGMFSPRGEWLYFSRNYSGLEGTLLRARYINDSTFTDPETLHIGEHWINWGGDEWVGTLSPREDELIFMGYRYWWHEGRGESDLFSSTLSCDISWQPITRLDCSHDNRYPEHPGGGRDLFPFLSVDNRTLYFERFDLEDTGEGLVGVGGYCSSKRIWSKIHEVCPESNILDPIPGLPEPPPFQFETVEPDSVWFTISDTFGNVIIQHTDTLKAAGNWQIRWYGIDNYGDVVIDGNYNLSICGNTFIDSIPFTIIQGNIIFLNPINYESKIPKGFELRLFPNPFNSSINFKVVVPEPSRLSISIYNLKGSSISNIVDNEMIDVGNHSYSWYGIDTMDRKLGSGVYFCRVNILSLSSGMSKGVTRKILLLK